MTTKMAAPMVKIVVKWSGKEYEVTELMTTDTVKDLKDVIKLKTGVLPERQKLLGLKLKGKPPSDNVQLVDLKIKPNTKIMMMGTCEETIAAANEKPDDIGEVIDDFDFEETEIQTDRREEFLQKVEKRVRDYKIEVLNEPRPGKKLLVLDVDYTLFDHRSVAEHALQLMRPYLHEFLKAAYEHYDIVIWSATSMKWIEVKMRELGVSTNPDYKLTFMIDSRACITVLTPKYGLVETKPLGVIWGKFESYTPENTIMFDDLRRNFLMNPQNGLKHLIQGLTEGPSVPKSQKFKQALFVNFDWIEHDERAIRAFREAAKNQATDTELMKLSKYLGAIASLEDLSSLNHKHWERYLTDHGR